MSHFANYERGCIATVGGIFPKLLRNEPDGTIPLDLIEKAIPVVKDNHLAPLMGLSLESTHNYCNGRVLKQSYISKVKKIMKKAKINKLKFHLDGARVWNAATALDVEMKTYVKDFDIINVCMSKGMGCPIGSLVVGSHEDI